MTAEQIISILWDTHGDIQKGLLVLNYGRNHHLLKKIEDKIKLLETGDRYREFDLSTIFSSIMLEIIDGTSPLKEAK